MILSDRTIREQIEAGRIVIDPLGENAIQPSSVDLRIGDEFRVFANHKHPHIDVREPMEDLTELVKATEDEPFILHPGEFVLAATLEQVTLPDDLVARLEGKSSLGRLGLLIHSSLPGSEPVLFLHAGELVLLPIGDIVRQQLEGAVAAFDPETLRIDFHSVTGWYEGPPDRIFEVVLASRRRVRVTAGHNLFTLDRSGGVRKMRTGALRAGMHVAIPARIPDPHARGSEIDLSALRWSSQATVAVGAARRREGESAGATLQAPRPELLATLPLDTTAHAVGDLGWDTVVEVVDTGSTEPIFDLEVRPGGRKIENFVAGHGGVLVSNTAGFVDAGWSGWLTLELSNVATLPIALYPGMKIGQLAFFQLTTPAERPYGSGELGSKYQGQRGPTPSKYFQNFDRSES